MAIEKTPGRKRRDKRKRYNAARAMPAAGDVTVKSLDGEILRTEKAKKITGKLDRPR